MIIIMMKMIKVTTTISSYHSNTKLSSYLKILDCEGPLQPRVVQSTEHSFGQFPASSVLILAEEDGRLANGKRNYWLAESGKTTWQGFIMRVDRRSSYMQICKRMITGIQIKNTRNEEARTYGTDKFQVSGSENETGPWKTLVQDHLDDPTNSSGPIPLVNFTFEEPVQIQYLRFDLISNWGAGGGGLQYFAAILETSK